MKNLVFILALLLFYSCQENAGIITFQKPDPTLDNSGDEEPDVALTVEEQLKWQLPKGSGWEHLGAVKTSLSFPVVDYGNVKCKFAPLADFAGATFVDVTTVQGGNYVFDLVKPDVSDPTRGIYKIQCQGYVNGALSVSSAYEIFMHPRLEDDDRCDLGHQKDDFYFENAKLYLREWDNFSGYSLKGVDISIPFALPRVMNDFGGFGPAGYFSENAAPDRLVGYPGDGMVRDGSNFVLNNGVTLRKKVSISSDNKYLLIRKAWSYQGSCKIHSYFTTMLEQGRGFVQFVGRRRNADGYVAIFNSRGEGVFLRENGTLVKEIKYGYGMIRKLLRGSYRASIIDPDITHEYFEIEQGMEYND